MVAALASLEAAYCLSLGTQTPLEEIRSAAEVRATDVAALSFSANFPARAVTPALAQLRSMLPGDVEVWVGGEGALRSVRPEPAIVIVDSLAAIPGVIAHWKNTRLPVSAQGAGRGSCARWSGEGERHSPTSRNRLRRHRTVGKRMTGIANSGAETADGASPHVGFNEITHVRCITNRRLIRD
jgi:hypothetical protein